MQNTVLANGAEERTGWNAIDWRRANQIVRNLRMRIFKASQTGDLKRLRSLQKMMLRSRSNTLVSVRRVTQLNSGKHTAGVDRVIVRTSEARMNLVDDLHASQPWRASPARRVYIPKGQRQTPPVGDSHRSRSSHASSRQERSGTRMGSSVRAKQLRIPPRTKSP